MRTVSLTTLSSLRTRTSTVRAVFQFDVVNTIPLMFVETALPVGSTRICTFTLPVGRVPSCTGYVFLAPRSVMFTADITVAALGLRVTDGGGARTRMGPKVVGWDLP